MNLMRQTACFVAKQTTINNLAFFLNGTLRLNEGVDLSYNASLFYCDNREIEKSYVFVL